MTDFTVREAGPLKVLILCMSRLEPNEVRLFLLPSIVVYLYLKILQPAMIRRDEDILYLLQRALIIRHFVNIALSDCL